MSEMSCHTAGKHLAERLEAMRGKDSRHTPHWNDRDQEAVKRLLDRPATREQIALARIEGITNIVSQFGSDGQDRCERVSIIARAALGLPQR